MGLPVHERKILLVYGGYSEAWGPLCTICLSQPNLPFVKVMENVHFYASITFVFNVLRIQALYVRASMLKGQRPTLCNILLIDTISI